MISEDSAREGYGSITPHFTVPDADRLIAFLSAAFGASVIRITRGSDDRSQHARMCVGRSMVMLNEHSDAYPANISQMHLYAYDADATFAAALRAGAEVLMEPNDRPHGDRMAGIKDPCGNVWWIATHRGQVCSGTRNERFGTLSSRPLTGQLPLDQYQQATASGALLPCRNGPLGQTSKCQNERKPR